MQIQNTNSTVTSPEPEPSVSPPLGLTGQETVPPSEPEPSVSVQDGERLISPTLTNLILGNIMASLKPLTNLEELNITRETLDIIAETLEDYGQPESAAEVITYGTLETTIQPESV